MIQSCFLPYLYCSGSSTLRRARHPSLAWLTALPLLLCACVPLAYDQVSDQLISKMQRDLYAHSVSLLGANRSPNDQTRRAGDYEINEAFYDQMDADIYSLRLRMLTLADGSATMLTSNFDNIEANLIQQRKAHQNQGRLLDPQIMVWRNAYAAETSSLLAYELRLKQGSETRRK